MSSTWETCGGESCGLGGITIPASAAGLKGLSLLSGGLIGQTDNDVMVIFPDSQQSLPASWKGEVGHVMALRKASPVVFANTVGLKSLKNQIFHCHFYSYFFNYIISVFRDPILSSLLMPPYVSQGLKYPLKWFVSICPPVHLLMCSEKRIFSYDPKWGQSLKQVI